MPYYSVIRRLLETAQIVAEAGRDDHASFDPDTSEDFDVLAASIQSLRKALS